MQGGVRCGDCGALNSIRAAACRVCGAAMRVPGVAAPQPAPFEQPQQAASAQPGFVACPSCRAQNSEAATVCRLCGAALREPTAPAAPEPVVPAGYPAPTELPGLGAGDVGPMDFGKCLDRAFSVYRNAFSPLLLAAATLSIPTALATALVAWGYFRFSPGAASLMFGDYSRWAKLLNSEGPEQAMKVLMGSGSSFDTTGYGVMLVASAVLYIVQIVAYPMLWGLAGAITAQVHTGRAADMRQAWGVAKEAYWHLVGVSLFVTLVQAMSGCIALALFPLFACYPWVVLFERKGFGSALGRSFQLVGGDFLRVWWWYVVSYLVVAVLSESLGTALRLGTSFGLNQLMPESSLVAAIGGSASALAQTVFMPIAIVFQALMYFDLRARREGFDLRLKLGSSQAVAG